MLSLTSHSLRRSIKEALEGPKRTGVIMAVAASVGVAAGKQDSLKSIPLIAAGAGLSLHFVSSRSKNGANKNFTNAGHMLADGAVAGGLSLLGYKFGSRKG